LKDEQSGNIIYDVDLPTANFRLMPKEGAEAEAKAAKASTLSQAKIREGSSNLFTLQNQYNERLNGIALFCLLNHSLALLILGQSH